MARSLAPAPRARKLVYVADVVVVIVAAAVVLAVSLRPATSCTLRVVRIGRFEYELEPRGSRQLRAAAACPILKAASGAKRSRALSKALDERRRPKPLIGLVDC